jgi:outer membrane lipoprotein carrier protein
MNRLFPRGRLLAGLLGLALLTAALPASAGEGLDRLNRFFDGLTSLRADFVQTLLDQNGEVIEKSEGVMLLERPGRFRLQYTHPYENLYVADGKKVWMYDPGLEQVTVRDEKEALGNTPALLLSSTRPLKENFRVKELKVTKDGIAWVQLRPRSEGEGGFESIRIGLEGRWVRVMEMRDGLGQITELRFFRLERNPKLAPKAFQFQPPAGVDVVGQP